MAGNDGFTKALLHLDGSNGSTTITDSNIGGSAHTWTANGNAQISTSQSVFGGASATFDGTGDSLTTPDSADWAFGSGDLTVDTRARFSAIGGGTTRTILWHGQDANNFVHFYADTNATFGFTAKVAGVTVGAYNTTATFSTATWYHVAWVRNGTSFLILVDGVSQTLTTFTAIGSNALGDYTSNLSVGNTTIGAGTDFNGFIDELRISKGIARWTGSFTPPTAAYDEFVEGAGAAAGTGTAAAVGFSIAASIGAAAGTGAAAGDHTIDAGVGSASGTGQAFGIGIDLPDVVGSCAAYSVRGRSSANYDVTGHATL